MHRYTSPFTRTTGVVPEGAAQAVTWRAPGRSFNRYWLKGNRCCVSHRPLRYTSPTPAGGAGHHRAGGRRRRPRGRGCAPPIGPAAVVDRGRPIDVAHDRDPVPLDLLDQVRRAERQVARDVIADLLVAVSRRELVLAEADDLFRQGPVQQRLAAEESPLPGASGIQVLQTRPGALEGRARGPHPAG